MGEVNPIPLIVTTDESGRVIVRPDGITSMPNGHYAALPAHEMDRILERMADAEHVIEVAMQIDRGLSVSHPQPHHKLWSVIAGNRASIRDLVKDCESLEAALRAAAHACEGELRVRDLRRRMAEGGIDG